MVDLNTLLEEERKAYEEYLKQKEYYLKLPDIPPEDAFWAEVDIVAEQYTKLKNLEEDYKIAQYRVKHKILENNLI